MERGQRFNFKLVVPPRVNSGQVSAIQPRENIENTGQVMNTLQQGYSKYFDKEQSMPFPNTSMVAPSKTTRQDFTKMKVVPPMEKENNCNPGQLYSKLFDEVEKIKCWKVQADSDTVQKERRLEENRRTIETQRKAILELQFGNESLSSKLEEQIGENEDLRNKNNTTRNLCNILKDTFQRSAEKMHLFECEREETHHLFKENSENVQKLIAAFESLRVQADADQQEMQKVKEGLLQCGDLKEKYKQDYNNMEKEVEILQTKLKQKESELQKVLLDFHETEEQCKQLQEATNEQGELLKSSESQRESLLQELHMTEQRCEETEKNRKAIAAMLEQNKEEYADMIQSKDLKLEELSRVRNQQAEEMEQIQTTVQELQNSLVLEIQRSKEFEGKLMANNEELKRRNTLLEETMEQSANKNAQIKILQDELDKQSESIDSMKAEAGVTGVRVLELTAELSSKTKEAQLLQSKADVALVENEQLKNAYEAAERTLKDLKKSSTVIEIKVQELEGQLFTERTKNKEHIFQIAQHEVKYKELLSNINELHSEKTAIQQQIESGSSNMRAVEANMKVYEEKAGKLTKEIQRLEDENRRLQDEVNTINSKLQGENLNAETLQKTIEENCELLQQKITQKEKQIKTMETKVCSLRKKLELKLKAQEEHQKEVKKLRLTTAESIKNKEDTEVRCQHKIADMVTLMEKHKSRYDRMVEEKDAELDENKKKEMEAVARTKLLELDLVKQRTDNGVLKQQLKTEVAEKENLQKELTDLEKEMSSLKVAQQAEVMNKQSPATNWKQQRRSETPKESSLKRHVFEFPMARKTPSYSRDDTAAVAVKKVGHLMSSVVLESESESVRKSHEMTPKTKESHKEDLKNTRKQNRVGGASKIKSYRIRTPPSSLAGCWEKSTIEIDPRSDSSEQNDIVTFPSGPSLSDQRYNISILKKIQSPISHKSPGNSLKVAAMKRMRDAGWTAVTGCDKKKNKKSSDKIFA